MRHKYTGVLTAVLMLTSVGCIDDRFDDSSQGRVPISLTATAVCHGADSAAAARTTRTTSTALQSSQLDNGQMFYAHFPSGTTSLTGTTFTADGSGGTIATVIPYFTLSGTSTDVRAYYPSSVTNTTTTFSVLADQSTDANYRSSDLMFAATTINKAFPTSSGVLTFAHKMAKVKINVTTNGVSVTKVQLKGIKRRVPFTPSSGAVGAAETIVGETTVTAYSGSTTTDFSCTALVPEQSVNASDVFVAVTTAGNIRLYKMPSTVTLTAGSEYTYNAVVKAAGSISYATTSMTRQISQGAFTNALTKTGDGTVTYTSSNTSVATVNASTGEVTPVAAGSTTITATVADGTNYTYATTTASYTLTLINRPKLPIEYVAPYNMKTATAMATANTKAQSGYFCWNTSKASSGGVGTPSDWSKAKANIQAMIKGTAVAGYHLPSKAEWCSVVAPYYGSSNDSDMGGGDGERIKYKNGQHTGLTERVAWGVTNNNGTYTYDVDQVFYNDYNCPNDAAHTYIGYGLRFKPTASTYGQYTCAYRYEYKSADASVGGGASLTIQVKYVGTNTSITISTISNESWWTSPDFTVVLPACGYSPYSNGSDQAAGWASASITANGYYWSATARDASYVHNMSFYTSYVCGNNWFLPGYGFSVRLFADK